MSYNTGYPSMMCKTLLNPNHSSLKPSRFFVDYDYDGERLSEEQVFEPTLNETLNIQDKEFYIQYTEEDGGYVVECLNNGVVSQGDTLKEARDNIIEAITLYLEECPEEEKHFQSFYLCL